MEYTNNLNLKKPGYEDQADIRDINSNMEIIDQSIGELSNSVLDIKMLGWSVPTECPIQNIKNNETRNFIQKVGRIDLSTLNWVQNPSYTTCFQADINSLPNSPTITMAGANGYCFKYKVNTDESVAAASLPDKHVKISWKKWSSTNKYIVINDASYTDATSFRNSLQGVYLYYEMETEITKPIDGNEAIVGVEDELDILAYGNNCGGKNLLKPTLETTTQNGITCTNNGDGTYTLNGTATANTNFIVVGKSYLEDFKGKTVYLSGSPKNGSGTTYQMGLWNDVTGSALDTGNGVKVDIPINFTNANVACFIANGYTANNLVFKPMLVDATKYPNVKYDDFVPYVKSNKQLTHDTNDDLKMLGWAVPMECPIQNVTSGNQFIQKVGRYIKTKLVATNMDTQTKTCQFVTISDAVNFNNTEASANSYCQKLGGKAVSLVDARASSGICFTQYKTMFYARNASIEQTVSAYQTWFDSLGEVSIYYELATPVTKNVDGNEFKWILSLIGSQSE